MLALLLLFGTFPQKGDAQTIRVTPELKELIELSVNKDRKVAEKSIDVLITREQQKGVRSAYIPKLEIGGKYVYAYSTLQSKIGEVGGFESLSKLEELMKNPTFPVLFPQLAGLSGEIVKLQQLLEQQGIQLPSVSRDLDGDVHGNYLGIDATAKMLLYSGGQVPNVSKALSEKMKAQEALSDKCKTDVINEVISAYDQLALLKQSGQVLDESAKRLAAEKKYAVSALNNGLATSFDTLKISVADAYLQARISEYESKRTLLYQKLSQLTGKPSSSFETLNPDLYVLLYTGANSDISKRAELRALSSGAEAQKYMLKSEKSHYLPKVQALASARYDRIFQANANFNAPLPMDMKIDNIGIGPTFMGGIGFKWDILDRSNGSSKVKQAELEVKKAENAREEARELLTLNLTKTTTIYESAIAQVTYKDKQLQAARLSLQLAQKSYNEGMINITERLAAETELQNAELEYYQAIFAQRQASLECYRATGDLDLSNIQ